MSCPPNMALGLCMVRSAFSVVLQWEELIRDFMAEFVDRPAVIVGNSLGSLASLMVSVQLSFGLVEVALNLPAACQWEWLGQVPRAPMWARRNVF